MRSGGYLFAFRMNGMENDYGKQLLFSLPLHRAQKPYRNE